jgi:hypothetical protein
MGVLKNFDTSTVRRELATTGDTDYNVVTPGLSYCGYCAHPHCRARTHLVVVNRGIGDHLVNDDIMSEVIKCPVCAKAVALEHISLYQCKATVTIHSHAEETSNFEATGSEIVKLGVQKEVVQQQLAEALMSVKCKPLKKKEDCVVC